MTWVIASREAALGAAGDTGVYWSAPQSTFPVATTEFFKTWPRDTGGSEVSVRDQRPSFAYYAPLGRLYSVGLWTENMIFTEARQFVTQFIRPPTMQGFALAAGAGPGPTGNFIPAISLWDETHRRRSPIVSSGVTLALANQSRVWSNLPIACGNSFVSHVELWISADGQSFRLVARVTLGQTTYTEAVATLSLGEAFESFSGFPTCTMNAIWNYRQVMAGDVVHPDRIYVSLLAQPEKYGGFFLRTLDGKPVTALFSLRDTLIVCTATSSFRVTGFTEDDITIDYLEPGVGAISHWMVDRFHDYAIVASAQGPYLFTGSSVHPLGQDFRQTWRDNYRNNQTAWETKGYAANDPEEEQLTINVNSIITNADGEPFSDGQPGTFSLDYSTVLPETGGGFSDPDLVIDAEARQVNTAAALSSQDGRRSWFFHGCEDGFVRRANVASNVDDDGDAYGKAALIRTGHDYYGEPSGDENDGRKLLTLASHVISEAIGYTLNVYAGDDLAWKAVPPDYTEAIPLGAEQDQNLDDKVPKTVDFTEPMISGRGFTFELRQANAILRWAGFGGTLEPGETNRSVIVTP